MRLRIVRVEPLDDDAMNGWHQMKKKVRSDSGQLMISRVIGIDAVLKNGHWFLVHSTESSDLHPIPTSMQGCVLFLKSKKMHISLLCTATGVLAVSTVRKELGLDVDEGIRIMQLIFDNWTDYFKDEDFKGMLEDGTLQTIIDIWDL